LRSCKAQPTAPAAAINDRISKVGFVMQIPCYRVTAPSDADETSFAYFAITPVL
jgi:hypothetical protein